MPDTLQRPSPSRRSATQGIPLGCRRYNGHGTRSDALAKLRRVVRYGGQAAGEHWRRRRALLSSASQAAGAGGGGGDSSGLNGACLLPPMAPGPALDLTVVVAATAGISAASSIHGGLYPVIPPPAPRPPGPSMLLHGGNLHSSGSSCSCRWDRERAPSTHDTGSPYASGRRRASRQITHARMPEGCSAQVRVSAWRSSACLTPSTLRAESLRATTPAPKRQPLSTQRLPSRVALAGTSMQRD